MSSSTAITLAATEEPMLNTQASGMSRDSASETTTERPPIDSGYNSALTTPKSTHQDVSSEHTITTAPFPLSQSFKKYPLPVFDVEIDQLVRERFAVIQPHFERLLLEHVRSGQKPGSQYQPMSTRVMMMKTRNGETTPHVVVFCQPRQKTVVQRFSKLDAVKSICQPGDAGVPSFEVAVINMAPRLRLDSAAEVFKATTEATSTRSTTTLCGLPITVEHPSGERRNATLGGVIKVVVDPGDIELYGITVSHVLRPLDDEVNGLEDFDDTDADADSGAEEDLFDTVSESESAYSANFGTFGPVQAQEPSKNDGCIADILSPVSLSASPESPWHFSHPETFGTLEHSNYYNLKLHRMLGRSTADYDWALFRMSSYQANLLKNNSKARIALSKKVPGTTGRRPVFMISASTGPKRGHLLPDPGRILLGGGELVNAHILVIDEEFTSIQDGDSGSWVVDRDTFELYGHLVATDPFNGGYVVPMCDILNDIRGYLRASIVELPDTPDFLHDQHNPQLTDLVNERHERQIEEMAVILSDPFNPEDSPVPSPPKSSSTDSGYASKFSSPLFR